MKAWWIALLHLSGFVAVSFLWIGVLGVGVAVLAMVNPEMYGAASLMDLSRPSTPEMAAIVGGVTIVQLVGMAVLAAFGALLVPTVARDPVGRVRLTSNLAFVRARWASMLLAGVIGLFGGFFPSWLFEVLGDALPAPMVDDLVRTAMAGPLFAQVVLGLAVAVAAPVCEEIVFRGYLWSAIERYVHPAVAWFVTSIVFSAYHLDPAQVLGVLPIAFTLGWARWWSGSLWPAMLLHAANNALALWASAQGPEIAEASVPAWLGVGGLCVTLAGCAALTLVGRSGGSNGSRAARSPAPPPG